MAPKIIDHDEHRNELARQSWPAFAAKGYQRVTTREMAEQIGISRGALHHYFPTKQELFEHSIRIMAADDVAQIEAFPRSEDPAERVEALLVYLEGNEQRVRSLLFLLFDYLRSGISGAPSELYEATLGRYTEALTRYLELDDPMIAEALMVYSDGLILRRSFMADAPPLRDHTRPLALLLRDARVAAGSPS